MDAKQFTFEAIGTHWWIEIFDHMTDEELKTTKSHLELISSVFNQNYSRFRDDSHISILNKERCLSNPTSELQEILTYGKRLYLRSQKTFNLLSGHILEARGYDASYSFEAKSNLSTLKICNPLTDLLISEKEITLTCGNVDIGGYGKGWLVDLLARNLQENGVRYFLVNGGGDMYGTSLPSGQGITIYLEHPTDPSKYLMESTLLNQGFAASSPFKRQWESDGKMYDHVVTKGDTPQLASFVKAITATDADAYATAVMLLPETALPALATNEQLAIARFDPVTSQLWQTKNFE
jgi:FAD:protein FMN transferase